jgi:hypothetical protein
MVLRVWKEKTVLVRLLRSLVPSSAMAREVWEEQGANRWPGLALEVSEICAKLGMEDANCSELRENDFKKEISRKFSEKDEWDLKQNMKT